MILQPQLVLPPEIIERIFLQLDVFSLLNCSRVCKKWRDVFVMMTYPQIGYTPKIMARIFQHLPPNHLPTILSIRQTCSLWKHGLDKLTENNAIRIRGKTTISSEQANQLLCWKIQKEPDSVLDPHHHNPFPSRTIRIQLIPDGMISNMAVLSLTSALSHYGRHVQYLNLKIQQYSFSSPTNSPSSQTYHRPKVYMLKLARTVLQILSCMDNLQGLSIYITSEFSPVAMPDLMWKEEKDRISKIPLNLNKLKAFRLISWSLRSDEMEWLYYKILRHSPNLEFFDPDFKLGYEKIYRIGSGDKSHFRFQLKCLKIAVPGREMSQFFRLLSGMKESLRIVHLDVFEDDGSGDEDQRYCLSILNSLIKCTGGKLTTISLSFYRNSRFVPSCDGISSSSSSISELFSLPDKPTSTGPENETVSNCKSKRRRRMNRFSRSRRYCTLLPSSISSSSTNLRNLRLRGVNGQLGFLTRFRKLERLILLDYNPSEQILFKRECDFYRMLPSLKELYTSHFSSVDQRQLLMGIVEDEEKVLGNMMPLSY